MKKTAELRINQIQGLLSGLEKQNEKVWLNESDKMNLLQLTAITQMKLSNTLEFLGIK